MLHRLARAAALVFAMYALAAPAAAQTSPQLPYQQAPSVQLAQGETRWSVDESWNDDALVYTFFADGRFHSNGTGATGKWIQTGARVVIDWPSYGAVYVGTMSGDRITGIGLFDNGTVVGSFILTRIP